MTFNNIIQTPIGAAVSARAGISLVPIKYDMYQNPSGIRRGRFIVPTADLSASCACSAHPIKYDMYQIPRESVGADLSCPPPIYRPALIFHSPDYFVHVHYRHSPRLTTPVGADLSRPPPLYWPRPDTHHPYNPSTINGVQTSRRGRFIAPTADLSALYVNSTIQMETINNQQKGTLMVEPLISNQEGLKEQFVDADGIMLHCLEWDPDLLEIQSPSTQKHNNSEGHDDEIPLVMLHGLGATADTWRLCAPHLCLNHRVVAFDLRGHGLSDQPDDGYDLVTIAEDAVHAMASLGLGKVALIGHGWGARVALVLAVRHPALVSHLVLVDCPHVEPKHWPGMTRERFLRQAAPAEIFVSRSAFLNAMRLEMADFWSPKVAAILLTTVRELPGGEIEELLKPERQRLIRQSLWDDRALSYYGKVACPVLLVPAAAQPAPGDYPPEKLENAGEFAAAKGFMAAQVARTIHSCTVLWMPDTAHDIQLHRPQQLAAAIASFIRE